MSARKTEVIKNWLIGITFVFTLSPTLFFLAFSRNDSLSTRQKIESRTQELATTATFFLGLAVMFNAYYGAKRSEAIQKTAIAADKNLEIEIKNAHLAQEQLIAERFMTAVTQLGHESIATRTGAIYVLERVAQESSKEYWTIMEILTAFVRENSKNQAQEKTHSSYQDIKTLQLRRVEPDLEKTVKIRTDIQAALTVIGRRNVQKDPANHRLNLRNADIKGADLHQANLQGANLRGTDLSGADLQGANLYEADLNGANLSGSNLDQTNLQLCNMQAANLSGANLNKSLVCGANLRAANLVSANLRAANFSGANLYKANLQAANLKTANLSGAKLFLANLQSAKLGKANLSRAGLIGANLQQANLNGANLQQANLNAAKLQNAEVFFANFSEASLREADLRGANLMGSNLQSCILHEANLSRANFTGANLSGAILCDVKLEGAILTGAKNLEPQQMSITMSDVS